MSSNMTPRKICELCSDLHPCEHPGICKPLYVFTEEELRQFANFVWYDALDHKITESPDQFESYWQQKFGGK